MARSSIGKSVARTTFEVCHHLRHTETSHANFTVCLFEKTDSQFYQFDFERSSEVGRLPTRDTRHCKVRKTFNCLDGIFNGDDSEKFSNQKRETKILTTAIITGNVDDLAMKSS